MRRVVLLSVLLAIISFSISVYFSRPRLSFASNSPIKNPNTTEAVVRFDNPWYVNQLIPALNSLGIRPIVIESRYFRGSTEVIEFHTIDQDRSTVSLETNFHSARFGALQDFLNESKMFSPSEKAQLASQISGAREILASKKIEPVKIYGVTAVGTRDAFCKLQQKGLEIQIDVNSTSNKEEVANYPSTNQQYVTNNSWYPNSGTSYTYPSSVRNQRYTSQYMKWNKIAFGSTATYEHDYFLYNYDKATYLYPKSTMYPGCSPLATYASTTWPSNSKPYLDTRFYWTGCETNELAFTIGAAKASALSANRLYQNYIRTIKGNANSDKFKLQAQLGYRMPISCYTTWCSFGTSSQTLIPAWNKSIPGTVPWSR